MKIKKVLIHGIIRKLIKENGIWVYLKHRCKCPCHKRILWNKWQKYNGIPEYILGHNPTSSKEKVKNGMIGIRFKIGNKSLLGLHHSKERINKIRKSRKKYNQEHPDETEKFRKAGQKYWKDNPDKKTEHIKKMCEAQTFVSEPELIVRNYTIKKLDKLNIKYHLNLCKIKGIPDITIETGDGHPIALFEDGCFIHGCLKHFPIVEVSHKTWERQSEKREYDRIINEKLTQQGYRVIRIWQHDVYNGNYKKIIKQIITEIKALEDY